MITTQEKAKKLDDSLGWLTKMWVRTLMFLGVVGGLIFGAFLGAYYGLTAGLGLCLGQSLEGPGAWIAPDIRRKVRDNTGVAPLGSLVAAAAGAAVGALTGPFWFQFVGCNVGRTLGESAANRF